LESFWAGLSWSGDYIFFNSIDSIVIEWRKDCKPARAWEQKEVLLNPEIPFLTGLQENVFL
jgi:hypothetical protein